MFEVPLPFGWIAVKAPPIRTLPSVCGTIVKTSPFRFGLYPVSIAPDVVTRAMNSRVVAAEAPVWVREVKEPPRTMLPSDWR